MITNFKIFENDTGPNFKEGDFVYCIDANGRDTLKNGKKYKIKRIFNDKGRWKVELEDKNHSMWQYFAVRFLSEIDYDSKKYNI